MKLRVQRPISKLFNIINIYLCIKENCLIIMNYCWLGIKYDGFIQIRIIFQFIFGNIFLKNL